MIKTCLLSIWSALDPIYYMFTRLNYVESENEEVKNIIRVRLTRYKGRAVILSDGTIINKNDLLIKIHLHNVSLIKEMKYMDNEVKRALFIYKCIKRSLIDLEIYISNHYCNEEIKGIVGITTLKKGTNKLGFDSFPISNLCYKWFKQLSLLPICLLTSPGPITTTYQNRPIVYLFMSKDQLTRKYGYRKI